jgi:hypothetical protein
MTPCSNPYPSALQHECRSHIDHICVHIYVDVIHECHAVVHED